MKKKIIFFDADGTLWHPRVRKIHQSPYYIYRLPISETEMSDRLKITPTTLKTLKKLRAIGIITIILSTHPHPPKEADIILKNRVKHLKLDHLFDEVYPTTVAKHSKGIFIKRILKRRKIKKSAALMVGDSYHWDYKSAKNVGIDALLVESHYMKIQYPETKRAKKTIKKLSDIFKHL